MDLKKQKTNKQFLSFVHSCRHVCSEVAGYDYKLAILLCTVMLLFNKTDGVCQKKSSECREQAEDISPMSSSHRIQTHNLKAARLIPKASVNDELSVNGG